MMVYIGLRTCHVLVSYRCQPPYPLWQKTRPWCYARTVVFAPTESVLIEFGAYRTSGPRRGLSLHPFLGVLCSRIVSGFFTYRRSGPDTPTFVGLCLVYCLSNLNKIVQSRPKPPKFRFVAASGGGPSEVSHIYGSSLKIHAGCNSGPYISKEALASGSNFTNSLERWYISGPGPAIYEKL